MYLCNAKNAKDMENEVLRIIEGGLANDKRKILSYSTKLADRLEREGNQPLAKCIREKIDSCIPQNQAIADAMRIIPIDADSRLQIVEVCPPYEKRQEIVLSSDVDAKVSEFIETVNHRNEIEMAGIEIKNALLLYGQPGCGKTSIAHYICEKTNLPLIVARLDGIVSSLLGSTAKNLRKIFDYAQSIPCILFLDEFDAIAKARDDEHEIGELKRVINSLLQNIDSMPSSCVLIAATDHPEMLDKAVWRRFTQTIEVGLPSKESISEMIEMFSTPFSCEIIDDKQKKNSFAEAVTGLSPSVLRTIFDRAKVKSIIEGSRQLAIDRLLTGVYEAKYPGKSECDYVCFLNHYGMTQTAINQCTGISLRKVKSYLSATK